MKIARLMKIALLHTGLLFLVAVACDFNMVSAQSMLTPRRISAELGKISALAFSGVKVTDIRVTGQKATVVLSSNFASLATNDLLVEDTVHRLSLVLHPLKDIDVLVETSTGPRALANLVAPAPVPDDFVTPPPADAPVISPVQGQSQFPLSGPLAGKRIIVSPGHGWYWVESLGGWYTQRGLNNGLIEDMGNWRMASHVVRALEHTGAYVFSCRERDGNTTELMLDNDAGEPVYNDDGWATSSSPGYAGGSYRYANATSTEESVQIARWSPQIPISSEYAVYVNYRAGDNRVPDARFTVLHSGGASVVRVDQRTNGSRWLYLGTYHFTEGGDWQGLELSSLSDYDGVVIADAVKFGGGVGSLVRNGSTSGKPRWQEAARYWVEFLGAPGWAYRDDLADNEGDVTTRPLYANWQGADLYLSLHSNAFNESARGTETYMYNGTATAGSEAWRDLVHEYMVHAIRTE
jgi:N-acetylmuramoyl-L-alanine amidase